MGKANFKYNIEKYEQIFYNNLTEKDKRLFAGLESLKSGYYGVLEISNKFKLNKHTIRKGQKELLSENLVPSHRIRKEGGGRKKK